MGKRLAAYTAVHDDDGQVHWFGPDTDVPTWAAERITNPDAWESEKKPAAETGESTSTSTEGGVLTKTALYQMDRDELALLAEQNGIEVRDGDSKKAIVEALTAR